MQGVTPFGPVGIGQSWPMPQFAMAYRHIKDENMAIQKGNTERQKEDGDDQIRKALREQYGSGKPTKRMSYTAIAQAAIDARGN